MVMPVYGLKEMFSHDLFLIAKKQLQTDQNKVLYLPEEEYEILKAGYSKELLEEPKYFDSLKHIVSKTHSVDYILTVEISELMRKKGSMGYYTATDLNQYNQHYNQDNETARATLLYYIHHTSSKTLDSQFSVTTNMNAMAFGEESGGETRINLANEISALKLAYEKGIKHIKKGTD